MPLIVPSTRGPSALARGVVIIINFPSYSDSAKILEMIWSKQEHPGGSSLLALLSGRTLILFGLLTTFAFGPFVQSV